MASHTIHKYVTIRQDILAEGKERVPYLQVYLMNNEETQTHLNFNF